MFSPTLNLRDKYTTIIASIKNSDPFFTPKSLYNRQDSSRAR